MAKYNKAESLEGFGQSDGLKLGRPFTRTSQRTAKDDAGYGIGSTLVWALPLSLSLWGGIILLAVSL